MKTPFLIAAIAVSAASALAVEPPPDGGYPNENTAEGEDALFSLTTGFNNTAMGFDALYSNTGGLSNTAIGSDALYQNTVGSDNTACGYFALHFNTTGLLNTAVGAVALDGNTTGSNNTACGVAALSFNSTGGFNSATGSDALGNNNTGNFNTASGSSALFKNTIGISNTASGYTALYRNTTGNYNAAYGQGSMYGNSSGSNNTAVGQNALKSNTTGKSNIAIGSNAGLSLTTGDNNIDIFDRGVAGESNTIRIGKQGTQTNTYLAGISGVTVADGIGVVIDSTGHLGTVTSSARYKDNIHPMNTASEAILSLKPVTFRYKKELDAKAIPQFGLVAEDVAKVDPDLVAKDEEGKPYTVRYEAVNAMLLNEFLKAHQKIENQASEIAELKSALKQVTARLDAKGL
jgi:hypothetical protein